MGKGPLHIRSLIFFSVEVLLDFSLWCVETERSDFPTVPNSFPYPVLSTKDKGTFGPRVPFQNTN